MLVATRESRTLLFPRTTIFHLSFLRPGSVLTVVFFRLSVSLSHARVRAASSSRSAHVSAKIFVDLSLASTSILSRSTPCAPVLFAPVSLSPCIHHPCAHLIHPTLQAVSSVKIPLVCSPSRGSSLPRLRSRRHPHFPPHPPVAPPHFPLLPLPGQRDVFCPWQLYVAQQRLRKGPHFSSEGVSPRGNCAIATSAS